MRGWFHGGVPNLNKGDLILPASETGTSTLFRIAREIAPDGPQRGDRIYLTNDLDIARMYASVFPFGDVYEVDPADDWEPDPDCLVPDLSIQASRGRIIRVVSRRIPFDQKVLEAIAAGG